jgi:integrase/recombinase XerD
MEQTVRLDIILWQNDESIKYPGLYPLKLQLYIDGDRPQKSLGFRVTPNQFDKVKQEVKDHPDAKFINAIARKKKRFYQDKIEKAMALDEEITSEIFGESKEKKKFFKFCEEVRPDKVTPTMIGRVKEFWGKEPIFKELNIDFMRKFEAWHKELIADKNGEIKPRLHQNSLNNSARYLRRIFGQAETEGYLKKNPFNAKYGGYVVPESEDSETIFLNEPERIRFYNLFLKYKAANANNIQYDDKYKTLVYFMLACYTGFRHSDWSKFNPRERVQEDNMIRLRAHKNKQWVVMEIGHKLSEIVAEIRKIGPFTLDNNETNAYLRILAPEAEVDKDITSHVGRHTFGCLCASIGLKEDDTAYFLGVNKETVKKYYHYTAEARKEQTKRLAQV